MSNDIDFDEALDAVHQRFVLIKAAIKLQMVYLRMKAKKQVAAKKAALQGQGADEAEGEG